MPKYLIKLRSIQADRVMDMLGKSIRLRSEQAVNLLLYGAEYRKTLGYEVAECKIAWLEFKSMLLIDIFKIDIE